MKHHQRLSDEQSNQPAVARLAVAGVSGVAAPKDWLKPWLRGWCAKFLPWVGVEVILSALPVGCLFMCHCHVNWDDAPVKRKHESTRSTLVRGDSLKS